LLIKTSKLAAAGNEEYETEFQKIRYKHDILIKSLFKGDRLAEVERGMNNMYNELANIFRGVCLIQDFSEKTSSAIVSYGERLSSFFISRFLEIPLHDARKFIKTDNQYGKNILNFELTSQKIKEEFSDVPEVALVGGFISSSARTGETPIWGGVARIIPLLLLPLLWMHPSWKYGQMLMAS